MQKAIDSSIGDPLVNRFGAWWQGWDKAGYEAAMKAGGVLVPVSNATREKWREELQPVVDRQLEKLAQEGVPDARAIYDEMRRPRPSSPAKGSPDKGSDPILVS